LWDSVFHSLAMNRLNPRVGWHLIKSVLDTQRPDGMIPHQTSITGWQSSITQPPLLAWGVWQNYQALEDRTCLSYALPCLERYLDWDCAQRDTNGNGLLEWFIEENERCRSGESGLDNSPRFDEAVLLDAVDFSTFAAQDMLFVAHIAAELGDRERAQRWQERAGALSQRIHQGLWDDSDGFYYDRRMDNRFSRVRAVSGFFPLLLDDIPPDRVERLVRALLDPTHFAAAFPVPSVALSHPSWSTDLWRGATWINTNYLIVQGLRKHGRSEEAAWLSEATINHVLKYYEQFGVIFEFYDAADRTSPVACDRKGPRGEHYDIRVKIDSIRDYHWSAALTACLLLEAYSV
jgi:glycogen debranching enzyme